MILMVAALPGLVLLGLSVLVFFVSLLALLVLTVPVYRLLSVVTGGVERRTERDVVATPVPEASGRRHIDVTIIEEEPRA
ncbi:MAG TPA: hypothetical protein VHP11_15500 [Tepidisphaeraceae bacterium]|nr:hypothetical protein [Tepidisphaeraceae bacterium]